MNNKKVIVIRDITNAYKKPTLRILENIIQNAKRIVKDTGDYVKAFKFLCKSVESVNDVLRK